MRSDTAVISFWNICTLINFFCFNLDTVNGTSTFTLQTTDAVVHVHGETGTNHIVTVFSETDVTIRLGPALYGILKSYISASDLKHVPNGHLHAYKH